MTGREPLACSLAGRERVERQAELRALLGGSLLTAGREGGALRLELSDSPGLRDRLARAVELERECCPFLELALEGTDGRLVLRIDGPPEASGVIDGFAALLAEARA